MKVKIEKGEYIIRKKAVIKLGKEIPDGRQDNRDPS